jgi:hypothetical protein
MSEGERVVLTEFPKGTITQDGDYFFHGGRLIPYLLFDRPSCGPLYRRIPDPVPALQARIAELETKLKMPCIHERAKQFAENTSSDY